SVMAEPYERPPADFGQGFKLIGEFMFRWADLERAINDGICVLLSLGELEGAIVEANMQFRDKIHTLRTCVQLWGFGSEEWEANADKFLVKVGNMGGLRNTVAHNLFIPRKGGDGVKFYVTQAKGKLAWPETNWTKKDFERHFQTFWAAAHEIRYIVDCVAENRPPNPSAHAVRNALFQIATMSGTGEQALEDRPRRPGLTRPGSPQASPETASRTPTALQPKPKG